MPCTKCGKAGHNAMTCGGAAAKPKAATPATAGCYESVVAQLAARAEVLRAELVTIERVVADLESLGHATVPEGGSRDVR